MKEIFFPFKFYYCVNTEYESKVSMERERVRERWNAIEHMSDGSLFVEHFDYFAMRVFVYTDV